MPDVSFFSFPATLPSYLGRLFPIASSGLADEPFLGCSIRGAGGHLLMLPTSEPITIAG